MVTATATASEKQNNFGKYLNMVINGEEVIVTQNGQEIGRFIPRNTVAAYLTDSLAGVLKGNYDIEQEREEALGKKCESID